MYIMATEEFKLITEELLDNYVELMREILNDPTTKNINLSFREYLDFYIKYSEINPSESDYDYAMEEGVSEETSEESPE